MWVSDLFPAEEELVISVSIKKVLFFLEKKWQANLSAF